METRINKIFEQYMGKFKNDIKELLANNEYDVLDDKLKSDLLKYIFDYDNINLSKDDFKKRKRVKNNVPQHNRCCARRANGEQCTRRKKEIGEFCGTHNKGIPHGKIACNMSEPVITKKKDIWVQGYSGN